MTIVIFSLTETNYFKAESFFLIPVIFLLAIFLFLRSYLAFIFSVVMAFLRFKGFVTKGSKVLSS